MNSKQFTIVVVITFVAGMVWLVSDIIFNTKASIPISEKLQASLEPINPTFSSRVLQIIESETLSTSDIKVNASVAAPITEAPAVDLQGTTPLPSNSPAPAVTASPLVQASPATNPNLTPIISLPSSTASASPLLPTP